MGQTTPEPAPSRPSPVDVVEVPSSARFVESRWPLAPRFPPGRDRHRHPSSDPTHRQPDLKPAQTRALAIAPPHHGFDVSSLFSKRSSSVLIMMKTLEPPSSTRNRELRPQPSEGRCVLCVAVVIRRSVASASEDGR